MLPGSEDQLWRRTAGIHCSFCCRSGPADLSAACCKGVPDYPCIYLFGTCRRKADFWGSAQTGDVCKAGRSILGRSGRCLWPTGVPFLMDASDTKSFWSAHLQAPAVTCPEKQSPKIRFSLQSTLNYRELVAGSAIGSSEPCGSTAVDQIMLTEREAIMCGCMHEYSARLAPPDSVVAVIGQVSKNLEMQSAQPWLGNALLELAI